MNPNKPQSHTKEVNANSTKITTDAVLGWVFLLGVPLIILSGAYFTFHNNSIANKVIADHKPKVVASRSFLESKCNDVPIEAEQLPKDIYEGLLSSCADIVERGDSLKVIDDMIFDAQSDYHFRIKERGMLYSGSETVLNIIFGPFRYDKIEDELRRPA